MYDVEKLEKWRLKHAILGDDKLWHIRNNKLIGYSREYFKSKYGDADEYINIEFPPVRIISTGLFDTPLDYRLANSVKGIIGITDGTEVYYEYDNILRDTVKYILPESLLMFHTVSAPEQIEFKCSIENIIDKQTSLNITNALNMKHNEKYGYNYMNDVVLNSGDTGFLFESKDLVLDDNIRVVAPRCFERSIKNNIDLNNVEVIKECAFRDNHSIEKLVIPKSVRIIGKAAFMRCDELRSLTVEPGVKVIMDSAFEKCNELEQVILPDTLEYIEQTAFQDCYSLKEVYISKNTKVIDFRTIGDDYNCMLWLNRDIDTIIKPNHDIFKQAKECELDVHCYDRKAKTKIIKY